MNNKRNKNSLETPKENNGDFKIPNKSKNSKSKTKTPTLDKYSRDLTKMANEGKLEKVVGRKKEIERVSQILSRKKKNNPILIGEPGVGKSSIAIGLAIKIKNREVSRTLFEKRIVMLDLASMVAGTKYRGQFEERIKGLMEEVKDNNDVILFIDEIHTIVGAGGASGSMDASNMFKPALASGEIQMIGATTIEEYRKHIEKDGALERRFQKVMVNPATMEESYEIINNIKESYQDHHNVNYTEKALESCVELTVRYIQDRFLPDKAIDALDEAGASVHISNITVPNNITSLEKSIEEMKDKKDQVIKKQEYEKAAELRDKEKKLIHKLEIEKSTWDEHVKNNRQTVTEEDVARVVSMMSNVPVNKVNKDENTKLSNMFDDISKNVIGQNHAIDKIVKAVQRGRVGMGDPSKSIFSGMLIGNSGVGKTLLAKELAKNMFNSEDALIRIDMSEYSDKISSSKIQGAAPGYAGYEEPNILDKIRNKPYSVVLFDEIEKAHPSIFNLFLQMLDDGHMTDSSGREVSFKNTIILMTSNVGTKTLKDFGTGIGFSTNANTESSDKDSESILKKELKKSFPPEFINRLDEIIYFRDLGKEEIEKIVDLELEKTIKRSNDIGYSLNINKKLREHLIDNGYEPEYGARPLRRTIQKWVEDYVTSYIIDNNPKKGTSLSINYNKKLNTSVVKELNSKKSKSKNKESELSKDNS